MENNGSLSRFRFSNFGAPCQWAWRQYSHLEALQFGPLTPAVVAAAAPGGPFAC